MAPTVYSVKGTNTVTIPGNHQRASGTCCGDDMANGFSASHGGSHFVRSHGNLVKTSWVN